jgi:ABC-type amino acid transport substrate-binding protein/outer membrane protein OmpA-like peptidoglycan-associated protein
MKGSRLAFVGVVGAAILVLAGITFFRYGPQINVSVSPRTTVAPAAAPASGASAATAQPQATTPPEFKATLTAGAQPTEPAPAQASDTSRLKPIWGPAYKENDGLGRIVCGAYAFSADYVLQQMQMAGLDVKHGFHLGIVPFYLNENYVVTAKDRTDALQNGTLDCLLTTFDLIALEDPGVLTTFINESAGGDQLWARDIKSLNDLKGKRIAYEADGPSEYFVQDLLATVQLTPKEVTLLPQPNQNAAIETFNKEEADVVAGWTPVIFDAEKSGGQMLASSKEFRSILGGIVMSRQAMQNKRTVIQLFHDAWFEALAQQEGDFGGAAKQIAAWGNNDYLGVQVDSAEDDLRTLLDGVAQANLADNVRAFSNVSSIINRLLQARNLWAAAGHSVPGGDVTAIVNPEFVQASARMMQVDLNTQNKFVNNSFSLGRSLAVAQTPAPSADATAAPAAAAAAPAAPTDRQQEILANSQAVATLPCSRFEFVPNTAQLIPTSQQELSNCALRVLQQNVNLYVQVKGSSAWPGPKGAIRRELVEQTAKERAQAVIDFFTSQGIDKGRLILNWTMPPEDHWETTDVSKQAQDRYVELTLLVSGL